jgi:lipid A 3-O-deacylase
MKYKVILVLLWLLPPMALAEVPVWSDSELETISAHGMVTDVVDFENDSLLLTQRDGFYTSGMRYSRHYRLRTRLGWRSTGWRFGQQIYTTSDVRLEPDQISRLDHPYAGWLYGGFMMRSEADDGSETALGLDMGCLGPCAGGAVTQEFTHRVLKQPRPRAWQTQLGNEWGIVLHAGGRAPYLKLAQWLDLRPGLSMRLGNIFTDLSAEASLRAGQLQSVANSSLTYVFLRGAVRAVGYDATLQGGFFSDDDARTVSPKRWTGEFEAGMQWLAPLWGLRVSFVRRSNEIAGLSALAGRQDMLRLSISFRH